MPCNCGGSSGAAPEPAGAQQPTIKYQPPMAQTRNPNDPGFFTHPPKPARQQA